MSESLDLLLLDRLERAETQLLSWGVIEGAFTWSELRRHANRLVPPDDPSGPEADELIDRLRQRQLLVRAPDAPDKYRTRMAETVRLTRTLRQILSPEPDAWRTSPRLVADFRFAATQREYPVRHLTGEQALHAIKRSARLDSTTHDALAVLLEREGTFLLADFQVRATTAALRSLDRGSSSGVVVASGTGSGKTLAFYLPALSWARSVADSSPWTKILAIYPRTELLKDQMQSAYRECRRLDSTGGANRKLRIGGFFGSTPFSPNTVPETDDWTKSPSGWICPYFSCPYCQSGHLVWLDRDRNAAQPLERLVCSGPDCEATIESDEIVLTRRRLQQQPPDVLFTTTETLNRRMSDDWSRHLFGLGQPRHRRPRFLLLDEIHLNTGALGAQTAFLIRRWHSALDAPVVFFGLSATLMDAGLFFADLTDLPAYAVTEVSPSEEELIAEGMEYSLALRGDPTSGAALMSTTIQTAMVLERMLDNSAGISEGIVGRRLYAFGDQLDSVNRLYWNLSNAEGWRGRHPLNRIPRSLASLRAPTRPTANALRQAREGQRWTTAVDIGWPLTDSDQLRIGRTSSQDEGVDSSADVVVSTASLEVGFDDPGAGAVIQHKAPRDPAQYVQRKGRAGRVRAMRPWMVTILSDYGRDRLAYQAYDSLFFPSLQRQSLPLSNRYVQKQQAGFAVLDWLGELIRERGTADRRGHIWSDSAGPSKGGVGLSERQRSLLEVVDELLTSSVLQARLTKHISRSLSISEDQALAVIWESPRSIILELLPTLHRRLNSNWSTASGGKDIIQRTPLPEFLPAALFNDLLVPEVTVDVPPANADGEWKDWQVGVVQALSELCPGRASRRFSIENEWQRHWVPVDLTGTGSAPPSIAVDDHFDGQVIGDFLYARPSGEVVQVQCLRPFRQTLQLLPRDVRDTSMALPVWRTQIIAQSSPPLNEPPVSSSWGSIVRGLAFHIHIADQPLTVRRFFDSVEIDLKLTDGRTISDVVSLVDTRAHQESVALGFEMDVDGLVIELDLPAIQNHLAQSLPPEAKRAHKAARFRRDVEQDPSIPRDVNKFQREWLALLAETAFVSLAIARGDNGPQNPTDLGPEHFCQMMRESISVLLPGEGPAGDLSEGADSDDQGRLKARLLELIADRAICARLLSLLGSLEEESPDAEATWLLERFKATLAAGFIEAVGRFNSRLDTDLLVADLDPGIPLRNAQRASSQVWISEQSPGGVGVIEQFVRDYLQDPHRFWRLMESSLEARDHEVVDEELSALLQNGPEDAMAEAFKQVRSSYADGNDEMVRAQRALRRALSESGRKSAHSVMSALNSRVVRPGSSITTDRILTEILARWTELEQELHMDIDVRTMSYICIQERIANALPIGGRTADSLADQQHLYSALLGLLWLRGGAARAISLATSNRFHPLPPTDRLLVQAALSDGHVVVHVEDEDWRAQITEALSRDGAALLKGRTDVLESLIAALLMLQEEGVDIGFLTLFPRLAGLTRNGDEWTAKVEIREVVQ